jgi:hypothetical protein
MDNRSTFPEDERTRILRMVEEGKISATEAVSLLDAMGRKAPRPTPQQRGLPPASNVGGTGSRWFRVRVTDAETGRSKATVNIPLTLMDWGLRIGAQFAPEVGQYDLHELTRILGEEGMGGKIIDVVDEEDNEHVEIFIE